jgi:quercetin dioxygenase-like cupin family protein
MSEDNPVRRGQARHGRLTVEGVVPLDRKVTTADSGGGMLVYEHRNVGKGGPPRHVHFDQDEWLYAVEGEFVVEVGDRRVTLRAGDSMFCPRNVPHAWAHVTDGPASLLFVAQPAGSMEHFFETIARGGPIPWPELERVYAEHGMRLLGPPIPVG